MVIYFTASSRTSLLAMASSEKDEVLMQSDTQSQSLGWNMDSRFDAFVSRTRSASISIPMNSVDSYESETNLVGYTGRLRSERKAPLIQFNNHLYGDAKGWARRFGSFLRTYIPGVTNPHAKAVQKWKTFVVICCLIAIFVDPLFFFVLSVQQDKQCIVVSLTMTIIIVAFRSITDFIYLLNMLLQFRLAYMAPESRVVGAGELVDHQKKIALHYLRGFFLLDLFIVLPLPQIIILLSLQHSLGSSGANLLLVAILIQYLPRLFRFLNVLVGQTPSGFIFETGWANYVINLPAIVLSGHVIGSCWYLFGLQRVNQCLRDACHNSGINSSCTSLINCGVGNDEGINVTDLLNWRLNENARTCLTEDGFPYGIYIRAVSLTTKDSFITRYIYSLFWGFQQLGTLAGNQEPSYFVWEVLFVIGIIGTGLLQFAFLIGNMQNFLQALVRRRLEMSLRRRDVEQWMSHRHLPQDLRRKVRAAERYHWAATKGVNEEMLLENLPEDLQRDIRRHLFKFVKKVRIFALMDDHALDAICERLRQKIYIAGSKIFYSGGAVEQIVFIVRGKLESTGADGTVDSLSEGNVCGEELLTWCLEHSSISKDGKKIKFPEQRLISGRTVTCLTNVEAFSLRVVDLKEVASIYARNLRNPRVQGAIRCESAYWKRKASRHNQVVWRYWQKRLMRKHAAQPNQA